MPQKDGKGKKRKQQEGDERERETYREKENETVDEDSKTAARKVTEIARKDPFHIHGYSYILSVSSFKIFHGFYSYN